MVTKRVLTLINVLSIIIILTCITSFQLIADPAPSPFESLNTRLVKDGFDASYIQELYQHSKAQFELNGVTLFFVHRESKLDYNQFITKKNINRAKSYQEKYEIDLDRAEKEYGVDKQVITAIILVETKLGTYLGKRSIFNTLSTMAALSDPYARKKLWNHLSSKHTLSKAKFEKKAATKSAWAYKELKAFITFAAREKIDPVLIKGSYAGAMGIAQFMPTNLSKYAIDGNRDGRVDLFQHPDAIHSIANYLKRFGWRPGIDAKEAAKVIYYYNHSDYYVRTILKIADRLKG
jgi:peptidoglycan lytic transglycosylase B